MKIDDKKDEQFIKKEENKKDKPKNLKKKSVEPMLSQNGIQSNTSSDESKSHQANKTIEQVKKVEKKDQKEQPN